jgi:asparagine synthase (glutamine-hydrolysing)
LETFSVRVSGRGEDAKYFDAIATKLGIKAHVFDFGVKEFEEVYTELSSKTYEPLYDNSLFPTYFISKHAAKKVTVVLSGEGGDEYFFGYPRQLELLGKTNVLDEKIGMSERLFFLLPPFRGKNKLFEKLFLLLKRPAAYYLLTMSPAKSLLTLQAWQTAKAYIVRFASQARYFDAELYLPNNLLRKLDLATMYASLEGRVPLLDPDVIALAKSLPQPKTKESKPVLKNLLTSYLPESLVYRGKQGFGLHLANLFKDSSMLITDLKYALKYLEERKLLPSAVPEVSVLISRYPQFCFCLLSLYHALRNAD